MCLLLVTVTEYWKELAEIIGLNSVDIELYAQKETNHAMAVLDEHCRHLTVDQDHFHLITSISLPSILYLHSS